MARRESGENGSGDSARHPPSEAPAVGLPILAPAYAEHLLRARQRAQETVTTSLDLGLTQIDVAVTAEGVLLPGGERVDWSAVTHVAAAVGHVGGRCFVLHDGGKVEEIAVFSETTNRRCSLTATEGAPTLLVAGIQMHRTTGLDPLADTRLKVRAVAPVRGRVLDTATGLGYTAIEAARTAESVVTIELDPAVLEVARLNPWSRDLFADPKISQLVGDSFELIREFEAGSFSRIIHDPPVFALAGQLYSGEFYRHLYRVLGERGRLFHYIGNPSSGSGARVTRGVIRRLREAGFARVIGRPETFGVVAYK